MYKRARFTTATNGDLELLSSVELESEPHVVPLHYLDKVRCEEDCAKWLFRVRVGKGKNSVLKRAWVPDTLMEPHLYDAANFEGKLWRAPRRFTGRTAINVDGELVAEVEWGRGKVKTFEPQIDLNEQL